MTDQDKDEAEVLQFLYDKRESQFNLRRGHEWQAFFAVVTLLAAADAAIITQKVCLEGRERSVWFIGLGLFSVACIWYEFVVQQRNRIERLAMDRLYRRLCDMVGIEERSVLSRIDHHKIEPIPKDEVDEGRAWVFNYTYMWAFTWQVIVLVFVVLISAYVPGKVCREKQVDDSVEMKLTLPGAR